jgi:tetratricopeptide (TPR) repeat protein
VEACEELVTRGRYEAASRRCEQAFAATADPRAGIAAARAQFELGHYREVVSWLDRLRGSSEERHAWQLAARSRLRNDELGLAEKAYLRALEMHRAAADSKGAAEAAYGLFWIAWSASRYREALRWTSEALEESQRAEDPALTSRAAEGLFSVLYDVGDLDGAAQALEMVEPLVVPREGEDRARWLNNRGVLQLERRRWRLARQAFEEALHSVGPQGQDDFLRALHLNLVETHIGLRDLETARRHLDAAKAHPPQERSRWTALNYWNARLSLEGGDAAAARATLERAIDPAPIPEWRWRIHYDAGRVEEASGDPVAAEDRYRQAAQTVEDMRGELRLDEFKAWLLDRKRRPLEALFRLQASRPGGGRSALDTFERAKSRSFLDAFISNVTSGSQEGSMAAAERVDFLRALLPLVKESPMAQLRPASDVLRDLAGRHLLGYFEVEGSVWLLSLAGGAVQARRLDASAADVAALADRLLARMEDSSVATRLGDLLLPKEVLPGAGSTLYVATDGATARLPFAALRRGDRPLVTDYTVAYVPTAGAVVSMGRDRHSASDGPPAFLGDPSGDLPGAGTELTLLAARFGVTASRGADATRQVLRRAAGARLVHLATHTGQGPGGHWLALADGRVTASEVLAEKLAPRVVVLASCSSATPRGRGLWGSLGAAFLAAGSQAVIASLWSVDDAVTAEFVLRFYEEGGASTPVAALARTQRAFVAAGRPVSSWAPFVVLGMD